MSDLAAEVERAWAKADKWQAISADLLAALEEVMADPTILLSRPVHAVSFTEEGETVEWDEKGHPGYLRARAAIAKATDLPRVTPEERREALDVAAQVEA